MSTDVLNPVVTVKIRDELIEVKELTWKDYLRAVKEMTDAILKLLNGKGEFALDRDKVVEALGAQENLIAWVAEKCTGRDQKWVGSLKGREMLALLRIIVDLNLSEEVIGSGKAVAGRMGEVFGVKKLSLAPSITSSAPAIPSATSKP